MFKREKASILHNRVSENFFALFLIMAQGQIMNPMKLDMVTLLSVSL